MARPSVVRVDWDQGERAGGGGAKFLPSIWRAAQAPSSMARAQQLFIRRFLGTDSKTKTQDSASIRIQVRRCSSSRVRASRRLDCQKSKEKVSSTPKSWLETKSLPLWRWLILILVVNSSLMLSLLINHYFKYGSIMWHLFLSIMINQMGMRLEYTSSSCHRFLPVTRAHGVDGA